MNRFGFTQSHDYSDNSVGSIFITVAVVGVEAGVGQVDEPYGFRIGTMLLRVFSKLDEHLSRTTFATDELVPSVIHGIARHSCSLRQRPRHYTQG